MSSRYYRIKKHRALKKTKLSVGCHENVQEVIENDNRRIDCTQSGTIENDSINIRVESDTECELHNLFVHNLSLSENEEHPLAAETKIKGIWEDFTIAPGTVDGHIGLREKLKHWVLRNLNSLRLKDVSELLVILREEGHQDLPKTAQTLIGTTHSRKLTSMTSALWSEEEKRYIEGEYYWFGIKAGLEKAISPNVYTENGIAVFIHIDGMQVYKNSAKTLWPIAVKIHHRNYITKPFVVGIYCGEAKPLSADIYLADFITEIANLTEQGVNLHGTHYNFTLLGVIADSPARAFIKCIKSPGTFYACERCETKGLSIKTAKGGSKRVYPDMDARKRTGESFNLRRQPLHHHPEQQSPFDRLPQFDQVRWVVLDVMHLWYSGVQKWLLVKWLSVKNCAGITVTHKRVLKQSLDSMSTDIPTEFQRKKFDFRFYSSWKATQYRFLLHYGGPFIFHTILPKDHYQHYLLLFVACRILINRKLIDKSTDYAEYLLRLFFSQLPTLYGTGSQVLSLHNLIHVPDDVRTFDLPLSEMSAFWGENYIGEFKDLVKSRNKPLTQIINRVSERECTDYLQVQRKYTVSAYEIKKEAEISEIDGKEYIEVTQIVLNDSTLRPKHPNNTVVLRDGKILAIEKILLAISDQSSADITSFFALGNVDSIRFEAFTSPTSSYDVGVVGITTFSNRKQLFALKNIESKCVLLHVRGKQLAISLSH